MVRSENVSSSEELYYILQVNGVDISKHDAKNMWKQQTAIQIKYQEYNEFSDETDEELAKVSTILEVWQTDMNERIALWNSGNIRIYDPNDDVAYNYIDKGKHFIMPTKTGIKKGYFLMFGLNNDTIEKLKKYFDFVIKNKEVRVFLHLHTFDKIIQEALQQRSTRAEERKRYDEIRKRELVEKENQKTAEEKRKAIGDKYETTESITIGNLAFGEDILEVNDQKFGIVGHNLRKYFSKDNFLKNLTNLDGMLNCFISYLANEIKNLMNDNWHANSNENKQLEMNTWMGSFPFTLAYENYGQKYGQKVRTLNSQKITKDSLYYLLPLISRMEKEEELNDMLIDLKKYPPSVRGYMKDGLVLRAGKEKIPIRLLVTKEKGKIHFVYGDQLYHIEGGVKTLESLQSSWGIKTKYEVFQLLSNYLPKDAAVKMIRRATIDRVAAIKKSQELVDGMMTRFPDRIAKMMFSPTGTDMIGYVVKGKKKDYFIETKKLGVYSYPQGRYMCIVDKGGGNDYTQNDKLVTRMLMLLNDDKFKDTMSYF